MSLTRQAPPTRRRPIRAWVPALLCAAALGCGGKSDSNPAPAPGPIAGTIVYTALGASDALGVGSSVPCIPLTQCPDGRGYVPSVARALQARGDTVTVTNLGIPTAVLAPSLEQLGKQYGRDTIGNIEEREAPFVVRTSTLVTLFAGGNDTNSVATIIDRGGAGSDVAAFIDRQVADFGSHYGTVVGTVRDRAPSARLVVLNLPNFAGLPYTASFTRAQKQWMRRISVGFARQANAMASRGAVIVDLLCDARSYDAGHYSGDGFHPNDAGYAFITDLVVQAATSSAGAPQSDCSYAHIGE